MSVHPFVNEVESKAMFTLYRAIASLGISLILCMSIASVACGQNWFLGDILSVGGSVPLENVEKPTELQDLATTDRQRSSSPSSDDQEASTEPDSEPKVPQGREFYLGREIARTMHYAGAEWLIRDEREREERCSLMLANLGVRPGMTICDMGCGNGFHSLPMAKMTGKNGLVIGVDVQPEMLGFMRERMEDQGVENVIPILGSYHNPRLPPDTIDLLLMVDVYHEFSHPELMLAAIRKSMKADGLVVLVEYREEDKTVPIKKLHKMSKAQVNKELEANGFKLVKEFDQLPWQHMMFFGKTDETRGPGEAASPAKSQDNKPGQAKQQG